MIYEIVLNIDGDIHCFLTQTFNVRMRLSLDGNGKGTMFEKLLFVLGERAGMSVCATMVFRSIALHLLLGYI